MNNEFITSSNEETKKIAEDLAKNIKSGECIVLYGNLGAGKTTFVQGLARGLGTTRNIVSPTFVIIRSYKVQRSKFKDQSDGQEIMFYHVDLYRLEGEKDIESTGLLEIIQKQDAILAIEWPEKMGNLLPKKGWEVRIQYLKEDKRKIIISKL